MKKLPLILACCALGLFALCYGKSSKAGVCFVVDGDCGDINARKPGGNPGADPWGPKPCKELGFSRTVSCTSDQITLETCRTGNTTYYRCKCKDEFKYTNDDSTYNYKNACTGTDNITKYKYKVCPSTYKYGSNSSVSSSKTLFKSGVHNTLYAQEANTTLGGKSCVDKYDLNSTGTVTRWTQTSCNQQTYKYTKYTHDAFTQSGECKGSVDTTARYSTMTCSNKTVGDGAYRSSCYENEKEIKTGARKTVTAQNVTCKYCMPKTCSDYGYFSEPLPGYRAESTTANGKTCYTNTLCNLGDYVMAGGYCTASKSLSTTVTNALKTKNTGLDKILGVASRVNKVGDYINIRVVALKEASDSYRADMKGGSSLAKTYTAFTGDTTKWGLMNNEDVYAIATNSSISGKLGTLHNSRYNLFKVLVDKTDSKGDKICETSEKKYAYADIYQCYWISHKNDSNVQRGVINSGFENAIASKDHKWPMFSYGTHIYMRKVDGYNGKPSYQNYLWYSSSGLNAQYDEQGAGSCQVEYCGTTKSENASSLWKERANSSKVTLEQILYGGRSGITNYVPLTYGARFYSSDTNWPRGVQPWRIGVMYAGELSDQESKAGACRGSGKDFYCRMRMYWHGTSQSCVGASTSINMITILGRNTSKLPTTQCFSASEKGNSSFIYLTIKSRTTEWDYTGGKANFSTSLPAAYGGKEWKRTSDFYKRGVQGCFTRSATEIKVKDRSSEMTSEADDNTSTIDSAEELSNYFKDLLKNSKQEAETLLSMTDEERGFTINNEDGMVSVPDKFDYSETILKNPTFQNKFTVVKKRFEAMEEANAMGGIAAIK